MYFYKNCTVIVNLNVSILNSYVYKFNLSDREIF